MASDDVLYSSGSFGQVGYSYIWASFAVVFLQDWGVNAELDKFFARRDRALTNIRHLRSKSNIEEGRTFQRTRTF